MTTQQTSDGRPPGHVDGSARDREHTRPNGLDDATVEALGKLSEALEMVEQARGMLYGFHRLTGSADLALGEAVDQFRRAGHEELAHEIETDLVGRNVLPGRWTPGRRGVRRRLLHQFREHEWRARQRLAQGRRHLFEAEMKQARRTVGRPGHEATPAEVPDSR